MPNDILTRAIDSVCSGTHLTADHASAVLDEIMGGRAGEVQTGAFLVALRAKGETVAELVGLARTMRRLAAEVDVDRDDLVDTAGTGGGPSTFNISTAAALVAAGAGCAVAKHGNRSSTSRCGSADLLEALGVTIELGPAEVATCIDEVGFGFMFAPRYHAAMKHVVPVRKELAVRTIFNFLGPLTNPAGARRGSCSGSPTAATRRRSPRRWSAWAASARWSFGPPTGWTRSASPTRRGWSRSRDGGTEEWFVRPEELGIERVEIERIAGGTPEQNAATVERVLAGEEGPARDVVLLNAGAAILVGGGADDLGGGIERARESIDSGAARDVLARLVEVSGRLGGRPLSRSLPAASRVQGLWINRLAFSRMSWLEELVAGAREDSRRRQQEVPLEALRARLVTRDGARPFNEALVRPGLSLIAEFKRRSPSAGELEAGRRGGRDGQGLRARRRRGPLDPHRGASFRGLGRTICERPARPPTCRSCARTSSSTAISSTRRRRAAPTRCC